MKYYFSGFALIMLTGLCAGLFAADLSLDKLTIARDGQTQYTIVKADQTTGAEKMALRELTNFLGRVTGASFPVAAEASLTGEVRGIYIGWTRFAAQNGIDAAKLGEEEWIIQSVGENLILTGGRPRGTLYAVYEFLEQQVGCHWLDRNTEIITSRPTLALDKLNIQGKPAMWLRDITPRYRQVMPTDDMLESEKMFLARNKNFDVAWASLLTWPTDGVYKMIGSPGSCHTFSDYVNASKWFVSHPEYFSLNDKGKRVPAKDGRGPGQLCLTNPNLRRIVLEELRKFIAQDRAKAAEIGCPPPRIYDISQNDDGYMCRCPNCLAIVEREGGMSGPMIDFINAIAEGIEKDYPDIFVQTFAYDETRKPPKNLKPRSNVIVRWCDRYIISDLVRPLNHPYNSETYEEIQGWGKIAPHLAVWDYWTPPSGSYYFPTPYCMIQCIGPDLKLFADMHVESLFCESPDESLDGRQKSNLRGFGENFTALKYWLGYKLMADPSQPAEPLIQTFMRGYYGAAAPKMNEYLKYLEGRMDKQADYMMVYYTPYNLKYLDLVFFATAEKIFDLAEAAVNPGSLEALHVQRERLVVDGALLFLWPWLDHKLAPLVKMPFDHEKVIRRYETNWRAQSLAFYSEKAQAEREIRIARLAALFRDPKLPEQFRKLPPRDVVDFNWLTFSACSPARQNFIADEDACGGMAVAVEEGNEEAHKKPIMFGVTGGEEITLNPTDVPQDEKYHLFKVGMVNVRKGTAVWVHADKLLGVNVGRIVETNVVNTAKLNEWNVYVSLKLKGPAYVTNSVDLNGIWMDRVLLVKPSKDEQSDADKLRRKAANPRVQRPKSPNSGKR